MLDRFGLVSLERALTGVRVLSVYLAGAPRDPAAQHAWRLSLDHALDAARAGLAGAPRDERDAFARCEALLEAELEAYPRGVDAPGWVAFLTADGVRHVGEVPVAMPTLAAWRRGPTVAPYVRALGELRPVIIAMVDARKCTIYRYRLGRLERVATLHAYHVVEPILHMGGAARIGFHAGTRGRTGRDAVQRDRREGMHRMLQSMATQVSALAGDDGWVLLGGIPRVVAHASAELALPAARVLWLEGIDVHASRAAIAEAARGAATTLRRTWDARQVEAIIAQAGDGALGVLGLEATQRALELTCVRAIHVSERFVREHPDDAEEAVRRAFDEDASVEEAAGPAAALLDAHGGIAASLRYRHPLMTSPASVPAEAYRSAPRGDRAPA